MPPPGADRRCQTTGTPPTPREVRRGDERRVVQVHHVEARSEQAVERGDVARQPRELAQEQQPAQPVVGARPDVRERRDRAGVHGCPRLGEESRGRSGRAVDVWLEPVAVERADQLRQALGRAAELAPVVDIEDPDARGGVMDSSHRDRSCRQASAGTVQRFGGFRRDLRGKASR